VTRDLLTGSALAVAGIVMISVAVTFPSIPVMAYGPGLFPKIVAGGLILSGIGIVAEAWTGRAGAGDAAPMRPLPVLALAAIIAGFALAMDPLGFHIAAILALIATVRLFGGGWITALVFAPVATALLHLVFYNVLRVPLPWGLLLPVAW